MGVNDVMKELQIDTAGKDTVNVQLKQDQAVTADGVSYAVSQIPTKFSMLTNVYSAAGFEGQLQSGCQRCSWDDRTLLRVLFEKRGTG